MRIISALAIVFACVLLNLFSPFALFNVAMATLAGHVTSSQEMALIASLVSATGISVAICSV